MNDIEPPPAPRPARRRQRAVRRRVLGAIPASLAAWMVLAGLPAGPSRAPVAGAMHSRIVTLTGSDGALTSAVGSTRILRPAPRVAVPGWSASLPVDAGSQAVGVSWSGSPYGAVEVRGHAAGGWTGWEGLQADPSDGPDDSTRSAGGLAWFGRDGVDRVELRVTDGILDDLELQTNRYEEPEPVSGFGGATAGAAAAQPDVLPRSLYTSKGWATQNSGCASGPASASGGVKYAVVHHTVNTNTYSSADVPALLASIYAYHTGTNRWCDIAYNFLIDRFGRTWEGRSGGIDKPIIGGHAKGFNTGSVGVSFLGQYEPGESPTAAAPTAGALDAAARVIGWKLGLYGLDPTGSLDVVSGGSTRWPAGTTVHLDRVSGHRDVGLTACPGQNLYDQLPTIRSRAKAVQGTDPVPTATTTTSPTTTTTTTATTTTEPPPSPSPSVNPYAPFASASALVDQQFRDVLHRPARPSDLDYWSTRVGQTWEPDRFIAHLTLSSEADDKVASVVRLYRAYFLRNPDHGGFAYWVSHRVGGQQLVSISEAFAASEEFRSRYGTLDDAGFVDLVYRNVLGRAPDSGGSQYWTAKLAAGTSRGHLMASFSQSSEFKATTADGVHVIMLYEALVKRTASADAYTLFVAGLANQAVSLTDAARFLYDSEEYRARF